jgi:hypothetical protein
MIDEQVPGGARPGKWHDTKVQRDWEAKPSRLAERRMSQIRSEQFVGAVRMELLSPRWMDFH